MHAIVWRNATEAVAPVLRTLRGARVSALVQALLVRSLL
jgi:hypothetical protein